MPYVIPAKRSNYTVKTLEETIKIKQSDIIDSLKSIPLKNKSRPGSSLPLINKYRHGYSWIATLTDNIFDIDIDLPESDMNDISKQTYLDFLKFTETEIKTKKDELLYNTGEIVSFAPTEPGFKPDFFELYKKYSDIKHIKYSDIKDKIGKQLHYKTKDDLLYPYYIQDMYPPETSDYFIKKSDDKIKQILDDRINSLEVCSNFLKPSNDNQQKKLEFYESEFIHEKKFTQHTIKDRCRQINWGLTNKKIFDSELEEYRKEQEIITNKFLNEHPQEKLLLKTFLDDSYFNEDGTINFKKVLKDRKRQYVFGYDYSIKEFGYTSHPLLFETMGIIFDSFYNCGQYVNWSLLTNLLYDYCALEQTDILFPIRFILDRKSILSHIDDGTPEGIYDLNFRFKNKPKLIFNPKLFEFKGIITI